MEKIRLRPLAIEVSFFVSFAACLYHMEKTHILTMLYRSHLTIFSIDNQHEKGSKKNAMEWSTTAYFPVTDLHISTKYQFNTIWGL